MLYYCITYFQTHPAMTLKRQLFLWHRWLGVMLSVLFVVWFFSGVVMMYVGFPATDHDRRIAGQAALADAAASCCARLPDLAPGERLRVIDGRLHRSNAREWFALDNGDPLEPLDAHAARTAVERALARRGDRGTIEDIVERHNDQWTVAQRYDPHRPLYRVSLDTGHWLHVSSRTGEIVLETDRPERAWNWVGSVVHWLYFTPIRERPRLWAELIIWLSVAGTLLAISGLWGGLRQLRPRRWRRGRSVVPYRGAAGWHQWSGLVFGVFALTFIFSGLLSMTPWGTFPRAGISDAERAALHGSPPSLSVSTAVNVVSAHHLIEPDFVAREAEALAVDGRWWLRLRDGEGQRLIDVSTGAVHTQVPSDAMAAVADALAAERQEIDRQWLTAPDLYYYDHRSGVNLPVLRLRLGDGNQPWYYLDPVSGGFTLRIDTTARAYRWWFNALHSLDFPWLIHFRPAWDIVVIVLSVGGLMLSVTGVVVGWRRLRTALARSSRARRGQTVAAGRLWRAGRLPGPAPTMPLNVSRRRMPPNTDGSD